MKARSGKKSWLLLVVSGVLALAAAGWPPAGGLPVPAVAGERLHAGEELDFEIVSELQRRELQRFARIGTFHMDGNGVPSMVFGDLGILPRTDPENARLFLESIQTLLRSGGEDSYLHLSTEYDDLGQAHYRFQQYLNGMPVLGAVLIVHADLLTGRIAGFNGHIAGDAPAETEPALTAMEALGTAAAGAGLSLPATLQQPSPGQETESFSPAGEAGRPGEPALIYVLTRAGDARLVWRTAITTGNPDGNETSTIYADAATGDLVLRQRNVYGALYREVYDFGFQKEKEVPLVPGKLILYEGANLANCPDATAKSVYQKLGTVYNYLKSRFSRDSFDGAGTKMKVSIHTNTMSKCSWHTGLQTALFSDAYTDTQGMLHDSPTKGLDTIAHEFGHGINTSSAMLGGEGESEMLMEAFSDLFGIGADSYAQSCTATIQTRSSKAFRDVWSFAENWWTPGRPDLPHRCFWNPKSCNTPETVFADSYMEIQDGTVVSGHGGSTVATLACCLLAEGGVHPGGKTQTVVTRIGLAKAEKIFYRALTAYLTPFATFADARRCTVQAARDLYGSTSFEQTQVANCWDAVEVEAWHPSPDQITFLPNGGFMNPSLDRPGWQYAALTVPSGQGKIEIIASDGNGGGSGNADIYLKRGMVPTGTCYDRASTGPGITKTIRINNPPAGTWYAGVHVRDPYGFSRIQMLYSPTSDKTTIYEAETNNSIASANRILKSNTAVYAKLKAGIINSRGLDIDFFSFQLPAGRTAFITMTCPRGYVYEMELADSLGNLLAEPPKGIGGYASGKFAPVVFNNNGEITKTVYIQVKPGPLFLNGASSIPDYFDPNQFYCLEITW